MDLRSEKISGKQFLFSIICFIRGSSLLLSFVSGLIQQDVWVAILGGMVICLPSLGIYFLLMHWFPGKNLIDINAEVFGQWGGRAVSLVYLFYFLSVASLNCRDLGGFIVTYTMPETPIIVIIGMFVLTCAFAVRSGVRTIVKYAGLIFYISLGILVLITLALIGNMDLQHLSPSFTFPFIQYVQASQVVGIIPFGEVMVFMMFLPCVNERKDIRRGFLLGLLISVVIILIIGLRDVSVLGDAIRILSMPTYEVVRMINITDVLTRIENLYTVLVILLYFFKISIFYGAIMIGIAQVFGLKSYKRLVFVVGGVMTLYASIVFSSSMENLVWGKTVAPFFSMFFQTVIPLLTLAVALVRGKHRGVGKTRVCQTLRESEAGA